MEKSNQSITAPTQSPHTPLFKSERCSTATPTTPKNAFRHLSPDRHVSFRLLPWPPKVSQGIRERSQRDPQSVSPHWHVAPRSSQQLAARRQPMEKRAKQPSPAQATTHHSRLLCMGFCKGRQQCSVHHKISRYLQIIITCTLPSPSPFRSGPPRPRPFTASGSPIRPHPGCNPDPNHSDSDPSIRRMGYPRIWSSLK